jgi:aspartate carbamoyltransferase catalytic subunit
MKAFEFLTELIEKSEWHKIVITDAGLAGKMVEFAEIYYTYKIKESETIIKPVDFAYWLNIQRYRDTQYMNKDELSEMYVYYLECLTNGSYDNEL